MRKKVTDNAGPGGLVGRFTADKKKAVFALCLIAIMLVMWARVFAKKKPNSASAAVLSSDVVDGRSASGAGRAAVRSRISFIELPKVEGRNDVLSKDFFTVKSWRDFVSGQGGKSSGAEGANISVREGDQEVVGKIAARLALEAIEMSAAPRAFINDELLGVGDRLQIADGVNTYECEVIGIEQAVVFIRCGQSEIELKLSDAM